MAGASQGFRRVAAEAGAGTSDQDGLGHDLVPSGGTNWGLAARTCFGCALSNPITIFNEVT
jgi:hypothetical protein